MPRRSSWLDDLKEEFDDRLPDGTAVRVVIEYRPWTAFDKPHEKPGCPKCGELLYDRLTHVYYIIEQEGRQSLAPRDYHLDSGHDLDELRPLRVTTWQGRDVFVKNGRIVVP